jgi:hypothetical protein
MTETQGKFTLFDLADLAGWLDAQTIHRDIRRIQNHHTWKPSYAHFRGDNHFALIEGMEASHLERGFSEIAQHFTTFPDGTVGTGRSIEKIPAGIRGANTGGICIENLGDFDAGKDAMTAQHRAAVLRLNALLCRKLGLTPDNDTIVYHHWYDLETGERTGGTGVTKSCPGTGFFGGNTVPSAEASFIPLIAQEIQALGEAPAAPQPAALYQATVTADSLNVRASPQIRGKIVGSVHRGVVVNVYEERGDWRRIHPNSSSWVHGGFLKKL